MTGAGECDEPEGDEIENHQREATHLQAQTQVAPANFVTRNDDDEKKTENAEDHRNAFVKSSGHVTVSGPVRENVKPWTSQESAKVSE